MIRTITTSRPSGRLSGSWVLASSVPLMLLTSVAQGHVKWFADDPQPRTLVLPEATTLIIGIVLLLVGVSLAKLVDKLACDYALTPCRLLSESNRPLRVVYYLIAVYFLGAALTHTFLAPHIHVSEALVYLGVAIQLLVYTLLLLGRGRVFCAVLIALLWVVAGMHDPLFWAEYSLFLAIAWIVLYADERPTGNGLLLVRSLLGLSLITLAFTEKLNDPAMAVALLERYDFNFMAHMGLDYSNLLFVYSAGAVELLLGLVLLFGWVTRLAVAALFGFMVATNGYFFLIGELHLAMVEAVGHLPIFACGILLLFYHPTRAVAGDGFTARAVQAAVSAKPGRLRSVGDTPRR